MLRKGRYDIQHNDIQLNDTQHKGIICDTRHEIHQAKMTLIIMAPAEHCCYVECRYAECCKDECRFAECRYAQCRYAECRGAKEKISRALIYKTFLQQ